MAVSQFSLAVFPFDVRCLSLGDYHIYWLNKGTKVKNPAFDRHSGLLLSLKQTDNREHNAAVAYWTRELVKVLAAGTGPAEFVIVPSHTAGRVSPGLAAVVGGVCMANRRFSFRAGSLIRTRNIDKLAAGGNRSENNHLSSMRFFNAPASPQTKILLDDVMTTGNSISAAARLIKQSNANADIFAIVLGKTVHD